MGTDKFPQGQSRRDISRRKGWTGHMEQECTPEATLSRAHKVGQTCHRRFIFARSSGRVLAPTRLPMLLHLFGSIDKAPFIVTTNSMIHCRYIPSGAASCGTTSRKPRERYIATALEES